MLFSNQKSTFEIGISDWSSAVCSSDLNTASKAGSACTGRLRVRHQALKGSSPRLVRGHDEAGDHLLLPRVVEPDDQALALHRGDLAVAELLVEHAVAALEAAAQRLDLRRDDIDEGRGALAAPRARALQAGEIGRAHV